MYAIKWIELIWIPFQFLFSAPKTLIVNSLWSKQSSEHTSSINLLLTPKRTKYERAGQDQDDADDEFYLSRMNLENKNKKNVRNKSNKANESMPV